MLSVRALEIPDVLMIRSPIFADGRGQLIEGWNARDFAEAGVEATFVQDNLVRSRRGVLRGLHFQHARPQGKLIRVTSGSIYDVAVDLRRASPTVGRWVGELLTAESGDAMWIPPGFAHGYLVLSDEADVAYKATDYYAPGDEYGVRWDDPTLAIDWPLAAVGTPIIAPRDLALPLLADAKRFP
jgi:dTDP-4-dehydrorhamnose 3,5-epimerase